MTMEVKSNRKTRPANNFFCNLCCVPQDYSENLRTLIMKVAVLSSVVMDQDLMLIDKDDHIFGCTLASFRTVNNIDARDTRLVKIKRSLRTKTTSLPTAYCSLLSAYRRDRICNSQGEAKLSGFQYCSSEPCNNTLRQKAKEKDGCPETDSVSMCAYACGCYEKRYA